jgi:hypothetical protein
LIRMLPEDVSYDNYIAIEGLVYSNHRFHVVRDEMGKLFYPWWRRILLELFSI